MEETIVSTLDPQLLQKIFDELVLLHADFNEAGFTIICLLLMIFFLILVAQVLKL